MIREIWRKTTGSTFGKSMKRVHVKKKQQIRRRQTARPGPRAFVTFEHAGINRQIGKIWDSEKYGERARLPQQRSTNLSQPCPSTLALQRHPPSDGEQSPTLPLGSHSHGLARHVTVRVACTEQAGQVRLMGRAGRAGWWWWGVVSTTRAGKCDRLPDDGVRFRPLAPTQMASRAVTAAEAAGYLAQGHYNKEGELLNPSLPPAAIPSPGQPVKTWTQTASLTAASAASAVLKSV